MPVPVVILSYISHYRKTSNISHTLVGDKQGSHISCQVKFKDFSRNFI